MPQQSNNGYKIPPKRSNLIAIVVILVALVLYASTIWFDSTLIVSAFIPKYMVFYSNGSGINLMCFLIGALFPAVFLRIRRQYLYSNICLLSFFIAGYVLKDSIKIYEHFYPLAEYLG